MAAVSDYRLRRIWNADRTRWASLFQGGWHLFSVTGGFHGAPHTLAEATEWLGGTLKVRCPDNDRGPQPDGGGRPDIVGCGHLFTVEFDPTDGMVDCPACGICFDPTLHDNRLEATPA